jgi:hypothetical protein
MGWLWSPAMPHTDIPDAITEGFPVAFGMQVLPRAKTA